MEEQKKLQKQTLKEKEINLLLKDFSKEQLSEMLYTQMELLRNPANPNSGGELISVAPNSKYGQCMPEGGGLGR